MIYFLIAIAAFFASMMAGSWLGVATAKRDFVGAFLAVAIVLASVGLVFASVYQGMLAW